MHNDEMLSSLLASAGLEVLEEKPEPDSMIGVFQAFRPDGLPGTIVAKGEVHRNFVTRLAGIYDAVRESHRADSMKDAYFVVRNPPMLAADDARQLATSFLSRLASLLEELGLESERDVLQSTPQVRVLEGKAPKHPRNSDERCKLLQLLQEKVPASIDRLFPAESVGGCLSEALYFVACDRLLRDYLRWPLLTGHVDAALIDSDPLVDYFELWRHGVKYRVFNDEQIDFYLPRRASGNLLDVGQFSIGKSKQ